MTIDRQARADLRSVLVSYMTAGTPPSHLMTKTRPSRKAWTKSVHEVSQFLYNRHDDFVDHSISVSPHGWTVLRRIVAFLGTELEIEATQDQPSWPFRD